MIRPANPSGGKWRMLHLRNTSKWRLPDTRSISVWGVFTLVLTLAIPTWAAEPRAPRVDRTDIGLAYRLIEKWVAAGEAEDAKAVAPMNLSGLSGVRVTLRWDGVQMGVGDALADPAARQDAGVVNLAELARLATSRALQIVEGSLKRRSGTPGGKGGKSSTTRPTKGLHDIGPLLTVDLQLALRLDAIRLPADATDEAIYFHFAPGFHGLRMSVPTTTGTPNEAWMWPASALANNTLPRSQLIQLLTEIGKNETALKTIARTGGPLLERFEVLQMTRPTHDAPATMLVRGNVILPPTSVTGRTLDGMIDRLAANLIHRLNPEGSVAGTYLPSQDQYELAEVSDEEQALAAYALTRWANRRGLPNADEDTQAQVQKARDGAKQIATALLSRFTADNKVLNPPACSLLLMTLLESPDLSAMKDERNALGNRLLSLRRPDGGYLTGEEKSHVALNTSIQALATAALASLFERTADADLGLKVCQSADLLWDNFKPQSMVGALPWLMIVESHRNALEDARVHMKPAGTQPAPTRAARLARLASLIKVMHDCQITAPPKFGPADVVGGFVFETAPLDAPPNPNWHSAYAVAFLAAALREPDVVPKREQLDGLLNCGLGTRFLAQLMFDDPSCFYVRSPEDAIGGVRSALWDNRLPISPTAMTLLATLELDQTLGAMANNDGINKTQPKP